MKIKKTVTGKRLRCIFAKAFFFCSWLMVLSCTKEKETERSYPRVLTGTVTNINTDGATFNGTFLQAGKTEVIDHGFVFSLSFSLITQSIERISLGASMGSGSFTATANFGLVKGKTYYVSAYARNKDQIFYAEPVNFVSMGGASPEIHTIVPGEGLRGDSVIIKGRYFSQVPRNNIVKFGDREVAVLTASDTELSVRVPATNGKEHVDVFVTSAGQTAQKISGFRYLKPEITGLSTDKGVVGDTIVIYGKKFWYSKNDVSVFFGDQAVVVLEVDISSIKVIVPASGGNTSLPVTVRVDGLLTEEFLMFTYLAPMFESFAPQSACGGDTVIIRGQYFLTTNQLRVSFGPYTVENFGIVSDTEIQAVVPFSKGIDEVAISVKNNGLTITSENKFRYLKPEITDIYPDKGIKNDQITIIGHHFGNFSNNLSLYFGAEKASVLEHTPNKLIVSVPKFSGNKLSEIKIIRDGVSVISDIKFQYMEPVISGFSPSFGRVGNTITITGQYFSNNANDVRVYCGDYQMNIESCSDNQIVVSIPKTAASAKQPIRISVDENESFSAALFEIFSPWTKKAPQPSNGTNYPISWIFNNEGFIALRDCWKYNLADDNWQLVTQNWDRHNRTEPTYFQINSHCYYGSGTGMDDNFYQISLESLERKTISKISQVHGTFSFIIDDKAYVCGGNGSNRVWQFDPKTNEWTERATLPAEGRNLGIAFSHNGKGYAGWGMYNSTFNDFFEYDPQTNIWIRKSNFPGRGILGAISFVVNGRIFAGLGATLEGTTLENIRDIWEYIPASDTWIHVAIIPNHVGYGYGMSVFVINNKAYIAGGSGISDLYEFDPSKLE